MKKILYSIAGILSALLGFYLLVMAMMLLTCYISVVFCVDVVNVAILMWAVAFIALTAAIVFRHIENENN